MQNEDIQSRRFDPENLGEYHKQMKHEPVYGPINSRRLGLSLGINPIQGGFACNWSCVYCQYGLDDMTEAMEGTKRVRFTDLAEIEVSLRKRLSSNEHYDSVTICGPTEPILHPRFNEIVDLTVRMRDKYRPEISTSLFTNVTKLRDKNLKPLDYVFMKLDAGNEETFRRFNRARGIKFSEVVEELKHAPVDKKIIQSMIAGGKDGNFAERDIADYVEVLREIGPEEVHLYSVLYSPLPEFDLKPVERDELNALADRVKERTGAKALVFVDPVNIGEEFRF